MSFRNFSKVNENAGRWSFEINEPALGCAFVNAIRRIILTDIPVLGFIGETMDQNEYSFQILANDGPLHNEYMQARLGLLPIHHFVSDAIELEKNGFEFELNEENASHDMKNITTDMFTVRNGSKGAKDFFPNQILITRLCPNQKIHIRGTPIVKTARFHACFSPVSLCVFHYIEDSHAIAAEKGPLSPLQRERMYLKNKYNDPVAFKFEIESEITPNEPKADKKQIHDLVRMAIEILITKMETIIAEMQKSEDEPRMVKSQPASTAGHEFIFQNEDDTIGNLIQSYVHRKYVRSRETIDDMLIEYIGYYCPHPLDPSVVLRIYSEGASPDKYRQCLNKISEEIIEELNAALGEWLQLNPQ